MGDDKLRKRQAKAEWAAQKMRHEADKKRAKAEAKIAKKRLEAGLPPEARSEGAPSRSARFADAVRGALYLLLGAFFGYLRWRSGTVWVPILGHMLHNGLTILAVLYWPDFVRLVFDK